MDILYLIIPSVIAFAIIYYTVYYLLSLREQKIRDKVANELLSDFDYEKEKKEIKSYANLFQVIQMCPICISSLVLRDGKYGEFWGCSSFPKCRFTKNKF
ncbi:topoisomerase DNA-binding C4 zinc finger domain-containing protein [Patescibacteria group bacterium]|nr:topoisomerase DNA-binding C4 zinc finger domain-containing protein [Patescibacteria group bacterium]